MPCGLAPRKRFITLKRSHGRTVLAGLSALLVCGAALLAGCTPASQSTGTTGDNVELSAAQQECVDAVSADVEAGEADTPLLLPEALDLDKIKGANIWWVALVVNQFATDSLAGFTDAAEAAGANVTVYDGQGQVNRFNEGIQQAISAGADGIVLHSIDPEVVSQSLADAKAAGIPVLNFFNGAPNDPVPAGATANLSGDWSADAALTAKWALVNSGCTANMVMLYSSSVVVWNQAVAGAKAVFEKYCPDDCKFTELDIDIANVATDVGNKLTGALQRDPDIGYVYSAWDSSVPFQDPVIAASGMDVVFMSHDGLTPSIRSLATGGQLDVDASWPPTSWIGWTTFDAIARLVTGQEPSKTVIPVRILQKDNVGDGSVEAIFPNYVDFESKFVDAWSK